MHSLQQKQMPHMAEKFYPPKQLVDDQVKQSVKLMWLDFETTGLDTLKHVPIEVAVRFTTADGDHAYPGLALTAPIAVSDAQVAAADDWVKENMRVRLAASMTHPQRIETYEQLDYLLSVWLSFFGSTKDKPTIYLAGNSVWYDRAFMIRLLPKTMELLRYRQIDVSSVRLFLEAALPEQKSKFDFRKRELHEADEDIKDSIQQFSLYRDYVRELADKPDVFDESNPKDLRDKGWMVAVHNDYRQDGKLHTFWCFTKGDLQTKGEGLSDAAALNEVRRRVAQLELKYGNDPC